MASNFNSLPPLKKRFRLQLQQQNQAPPPESNLPAKKRKLCRDPNILPPPPTPICLPAKKRVWAIHPDSSPIKSSFDLNLEYTPSPEKTNIDDIIINQEIEDNNNDDSEDDGILCAICDSTDGEPQDPIVFCDGCDLMVHVSCYGDPLVKGVPEGDWFCNQCLDSGSGSGSAHGLLKCCLCPVSGGAMKPTTDGRWAHIVCAVLVPEVFFVDPEGREGIDCSNVPKRRWKEVCYVCGKKQGCGVECSEPKCPLAFHVGCGLKEGLCIELKEGKSSGGIVAGFCKKHTELWKKQQQTGKFRIVARDEDKQ